jgi:hypothetical protein
MKFTYQINEVEKKDLSELVANLFVGREPAENECVKIEITTDGKVEISASKEGWIFLAKVSVEMAYLSEKDPTFHIHRSQDFKWEVSNYQEAIRLLQLIK